MVHPAALRTPQVLWAEFEAIHPGIPRPLLSDAERVEVGAAVGAGASAEALADAVSMAEYCKAVHGLAALRDGEGQSALCLSGGGIRSAAFGLGVLQGFARRGMLSQFDYLSTVSGGGYIGCWLTALSHRWASSPAGAGARGFAAVEALVAGRPAYAAEEPEPFRWLRKNQKFLTPRLGMLSADIWAAGALFVRDLVLNWLVYVPAIAAVLLLPRLVELAVAGWVVFAPESGSLFGWAINAWVLNHVQGVWPHPTVVAGPPGWKGWTDVGGAVLVLLAMVTAMVHRTSAGSSAMDDRRFRLMVVLPLLGGGFLLVLFNAALLVRGASPDVALLVQWLIGVPATFVGARLIAWVLRWAWGRGTGRVEALELVILALSGLVTGLAVWSGLALRTHVSGGRGTVLDLAVFGVPWLLLAFVAGQVAYAGLATFLVSGQRDQEWMGRASGHYLMWAAIWAAAGCLTLYATRLEHHLATSLALSGVAGGMTLATASSSISKATAALAAARERVSVSVLVKVAAFVFLFSASVAVSSVLDVVIAAVSGVSLPGVGDHLMMAFRDGAWADPRPSPGVSPTLGELRGEAWGALRVGLWWFVGLAGGALAASVFVDVNQFSLHALYRNRLVRTFLGASNVASVTGRAAERSAFSGFAESDELAMGELVQGAGLGRGVAGPFPVIGMALNLVRSRDPAWQERKAGPFTATPLHLGSPLVGYREQRQARGLSLGTAMAISGAAASPNSGYHSSALVGLLMMLFNVRLGWWLRNPRCPPQPPALRNLSLFVQEALGRTTDDASHVYLSDGGHFDNLGLYEMLRRRCRVIVVVDATQDADFALEDLGRTLRTASVDMGITVSMAPAGLHKRTNPATSGVYAAVGVITYPERAGPLAAVPGQGGGTLVYIKPGFFEDAPVDVRAFAAGDAQFPHDATLNQWFTESQFESYRVLGSHAASRLLGRAAWGTALSKLPALVRAYLGPAVSGAGRPGGGRGGGGPRASRPNGPGCG